MIKARGWSGIGSGIGASVLALAGSPASAGTAAGSPSLRAVVAQGLVGPRLYAALLPVPDRAFGLKGGEDSLVRLGRGMIEFAPFGGGFHLSARDRPDRGGIGSWSSLKLGSARGMSFAGGLDTLGSSHIVRKFAPALMMGYGQRPERGASFSLKAGMLLRNRFLVSPLAGLGRTSIPDIGGSGHGGGAALVQARLGYRF